LAAASAAPCCRVSGPERVPAAEIVRLFLLADAPLVKPHLQWFWDVDDRFLDEEGCHGPDSADARRNLRLCEDEFEVARQGWIDFGVWHEPSGPK
jgi:hypothetical protein